MRKHLLCGSVEHWSNTENDAIDSMALKLEICLLHVIPLRSMWHTPLHEQQNKTQQKKNYYYR